MFLSTVRVALGGLAFFAAAEVVAVPSLSLRVSGPQSVEGVENLKLVTTVTNTGNETLKLLKDPNGPLSKIQTRTFDIRDATGKQPRFTGTKLKYIPSMAALLEGEDYFTVLSPGESLDVEHDCMSLWKFETYPLSLKLSIVSGAYNFTSPGSYRFEAHNRFFYVDPITSAAIPIHAQVVAHEASIAGRLAIERKNVASTTVLRKREYIRCSEDMEASLEAAAVVAEDYARNSRRCVCYRVTLAAWH